MQEPHVRLAHQLKTVMYAALSLADKLHAALKNHPCEAVEDDEDDEVCHLCALKEEAGHIAWAVLAGVEGIQTHFQGTGLYWNGPDDEELLRWLDRKPEADKADDEEGAPKGPQNPRAAVLLFRALRAAVANCYALDGECNMHSCPESRDETCIPCQHVRQAEGMLYTLQTFRDLVQSNLIDDDPAAPAAAAPAEPVTPATAPAENPFFTTR
jgi:hypothetical protein